MIEHLNSIAAGWWAWMVPMLWQTALLAAFVWALDLLVLRRRGWPQVRYALWLLVFARLLVPPTFALPTSLSARLLALRGAHPVAVQPSATARPVLPDFDLPDLPPTHRATVDTVPEVVAAPVMTREIPRVPLSAKSWAMFASTAVSLFFLSWLLLRVLRLRRLARDSDECGPEIAEALAQHAAQLRLRRLPRLVMTDGVPSAAVCGVFRPILFLPTAYRDLPREQLGHVLLHELAHLKRRDLLVNAAQSVLHILYWFNPVLWLAGRRLRSLREICCDATVANLLRERTSDYCRTLVDVAGRASSAKFGLGLGLLGLFESPSRLRQRIECLARPAWKHRRLRLIVAAVAAAAVLLCIVPMAAIKAAPPPDAPAPANSLPGSGYSIKDAWVDATAAALLEATDEAGMPVRKPKGLVGFNQTFRNLGTLAGRKTSLEEFIKVAYIMGEQETPVAKGQRLIWLLYKLPNGPWTGIKALADTPENRNAVMEAAKGVAGEDTSAPAKGNPPKATYEDMLKLYPPADLDSAYARSVRMPTAEEIKVLGALWPQVPPEENVAYYFATAANALAPDETAPAGSAVTETKYAGNVAALRKWVELNLPALKTMRKGFEQKTCRFPILLNRERSQPIPDMRSLAMMRQLARTCTDAGFLAELEGRPDTAAEAYADCLRVGAAVRRDGVLIEALVGTAIGGIGQIGLDRLLANSSPREEALKTVILRCREAEVATDEPARIWATECAYGEAVTRLRKDATDAGKVSEMFRNQRAAVTEFIAKKTLPELLQQKTMQEFHAMGVNQPGVSPNPVVPALARAFENLGRADVKIKETEIRAALALYQKKHGGALPENLDALVPDILPGVPIDPYSGKPMRYAKTPEGWKLWSVGADNTDNGGQGDPDPSKVWDGPDYVFVSKLPSNLEKRSAPRPAPMTPAAPPAAK